MTEHISTHQHKSTWSDRLTRNKPSSNCNANSHNERDDLKTSLSNGRPPQTRLKSQVVGCHVIRGDAGGKSVVQSAGQSWITVYTFVFVSLLRRMSGCFEQSEKVHGRFSPIWSATMHVTRVRACPLESKWKKSQTTIVNARHLSVAAASVK